MKKLMIFAAMLAIVALATSCGYTSEVIEVKGTGLSTYTCQLENGKIVIGLQKTKSAEPVVRAAYDKIVFENLYFVADFTAKDGKVYKNVFDVEGKMISPDAFTKCELSNGFLSCLSAKGKYAYFADKNKIFGPYQEFIHYGGVYFYVGKDGVGVLNNELKLLFPAPTKTVAKVKDVKTEKIFYIIPDGKKFQLLDDAGKKVKTLSAWSYNSLLKKLLKKEMILDSTIILGELPNIKTF